VSVVVLCPIESGTRKLPLFKFCLVHVYNCLCTGGDVCDEAHIVKLFIRLLVIVYRWDDRRFVADHCSVCDTIVVLERSRLLACAKRQHPDKISNEVRLPPEFKHILKGRKRK
jgi:hypothetical protein